MIEIKPTIRYKGIAGMGKREWNNNFLKPSFYEVGKFWHEYVLPKHFTEAGAREYGYKPRSAKYTKAKVTFLKHNKPLVWSEELLNSTKKANIYATFKRVRVTLPNARKANYRSSPNAPNMADELRRLSKNDIYGLAAVLNNHILKRIKGGGYQGKAIRFAKPDESGGTSVPTGVGKRRRTSGVGTRKRGR